MLKLILLECSCWHKHKSDNTTIRLSPSWIFVFQSLPWGEIVYSTVHSLLVHTGGRVLKNDWWFILDREPQIASRSRPSSVLRPPALYSFCEGLRALISIVFKTLLILGCCWHGVKPEHCLFMRHFQKTKIWVRPISWVVSITKTPTRSPTTRSLSFSQ